jgi:hypothetical protein
MTYNEPTGARLDEALQAFPDSAAAVDIIAQCLKIALNGTDPGEQHEQIRATLAGATTEARTRAGVVCSALVRVAGELRGLILAIKDEQGDADIIAGDCVVLPEGWLVVQIGGREIARMPFDPQRPAEQAEQLAEQTLAEYVSLHIQGRAEVGGLVGSALEDRGPLRTKRMPRGELVASVRVPVRLEAPERQQTPEKPEAPTDRPGPAVPENTPASDRSRKARRGASSDELGGPFGIEPN